MNPTVLERVAAGAERVVRVTGEIAAWTGLALVLVVAGNVIGRYFFGLSSVATQEAEWHLMAVGALFGMSYGLNQGGEVRVDIFYAGFSERTKAAIDAVSGLFLCLVSLALVWFSLSYVEQSYSIAEGSPDPGGLTHRYILKAALPAAFALLALQALAMALRAAAVFAAGGNDAGPDPSSMHEPS